jgi:hypothetical protein
LENADMNKLTKKGWKLMCIHDNTVNHRFHPSHSFKCPYNISCNHSFAAKNTTVSKIRHGTFIRAHTAAAAMSVAKETPDQVGPKHILSARFIMT